MAVEKDDGENELSGCWCVLCSFLLAQTRDFKKAVMNEYPRFLSPIMMHKTIYMVEFLLLSFMCAIGSRLRVHLKSACFSLARSLDSLSFSLSLRSPRAFSKQVRQSCSTFLTANSSRQNYERWEVLVALETMCYSNSVSSSPYLARSSTSYRTKSSSAGEGRIRERRRPVPPRVATPSSPPTKAANTSSQTDSSSITCYVQTISANSSSGSASPSPRTTSPCARSRFGRSPTSSRAP